MRRPYATPACPKARSAPVRVTDEAPGVPLVFESFLAVAVAFTLGGVYFRHPMRTGNCLLVIIVSVAACGGRTALDGLEGSASAGGTWVTGGRNNTGAWTSIGGIANTGGVPATGGTAPVSTCTADSDCTYCWYGFAPPSASQCYCPAYCALNAMTVQECAVNETAWNAYCGHSYTACQAIPCAVAPPIRCMSGMCTFQLGTAGAPSAGGSTSTGGTKAAGGTPSVGGTTSTGGTLAPSGGSFARNTENSGGCASFSTTCKVGSFLGQWVTDCPPGAVCHMETQFCGMVVGCAVYPDDAGAGGDAES